MFPGSAEASIALLLTIVPGFVASAMWSRARTWKGPDTDFRLVLQSLVLSILIQGILLPLTLTWIYPVRGEIERYPARVTTWVLLATLVVPVVGGLGVARATDRVEDPADPPRSRVATWASAVWPSPSPPSVWDWFFKSRRLDGKFLVITFKDGRRVGGAFSQGSVAMTTPEPHGLFLAVEWEVDESGAITRPIPAGAGIMIRDVEDVLTVRVLEVRDDGRQAPVEGHGLGKGQGPH